MGTVFVYNGTLLITEIQRAVNPPQNLYNRNTTLENNATIDTRDEQVDIPRLAAIEFSGDLKHTGSAFFEDNTRFHSYYGVAGDTPELSSHVPTGNGQVVVVSPSENYETKE